MASITFRTTDEKRDQLHALAREKGISVNRLLDEWATIAITEKSAFERFEMMQKKGNPENALKILRKKADD